MINEVFNEAERRSLVPCFSCRNPVLSQELKKWNLLNDILIGNVYFRPFHGDLRFRCYT